MSEESKSEKRPLREHFVFLMSVVVTLIGFGVVVVYMVVPLLQTSAMGSAAFEEMAIRNCIEVPVLHGLDKPQECLDEVSTWHWWLLDWGDELHRERTGGVDARTRLEVKAVESSYTIAQRGAVDRDEMIEARERLRGVLEEMKDDERQLNWVMQRWNTVAGPEYEQRLLVEGDAEEREAALRSILRREEPSEWDVLASVPVAARELRVPVAAALCLAGEVEAAQERIAGLGGGATPREELAMACGVGQPESDHLSTEAKTMAIATGVIDPNGPMMEAVADEQFEVEDDHSQAVIAYGLLGLDEEGQELWALLEQLGDRRQDVLATRDGCSVPTRGYPEAEAWKDPEAMEALAGRLGAWIEDLEGDEPEEVEAKWGRDLQAYQQQLWLEAARQWVWFGDGDRAEETLGRRDDSQDESEQWCEALVRVEVGDVEGARALQEQYEGQESHYDWDDLGLELLVLSGQYDRAYERGLEWWESLRGTSVDALGDELDTIGLWLWAAMESGHYDEIYRRVGDAVEDHGFAMVSAEVLAHEEAMIWRRMEFDEEDISESDRSLASLAYLHQWVDDEADSAVWIDVVLGGSGAERGVLDNHWLRIRAKEAVGRSEQAADRRATLEALQAVVDGPEQWWLMRQL